MRKIDTLDEMKQIELGVMEKVHKICEEHHITYFIAYGTLIGAIRHQGFIPWDDDIDIVMPREEYDRFIDLFKDGRYSEMNIALANHKAEHSFCRAMTKVIDTRTWLDEEEYTDDPIGVFVDIWPMDGVPKNKLIAKAHKFAVRCLHRVLYLKVKKPANQQMGHRLGTILLAPFSAKWVVDKTEKLLRRYPFVAADSVSCYVDPYLKELKKEWFNDRVLMPFETAEFYVPAAYHEVLTSIYGDYMQLPPVEKRIPHHIVNTYLKEE